MSTATQPPWLEHLAALAEAIETGSELPPRPDWMEADDEDNDDAGARPSLTLIRGGRDA